MMHVCVQLTRDRFEVLNLDCQLDTRLRSPRGKTSGSVYEGIPTEVYLKREYLNEGDTNPWVRVPD